MAGIACYEANKVCITVFRLGKFSSFQHYQTGTGGCPARGVGQRAVARATQRPNFTDEG